VQDVKPLPLKAAPLIIGNGATFLLDNSPHPNATAVFVNWLLTRDTQVLWAQITQENSRRVDVPPGNLDARPDPGRASSYVTLATEEGDAYTEETRQMVARLLP
jgi:ABC-type Fe3+ transport system substrate-binding protein